jgi:hypothetical protein|nr:MAG TPA: hypothetical protein [Caudoviricetes sp.]
MAKSALQRLVERNTGVSRRTSGASTKLSRRTRTAAKRKSRGGQGG